MITIHCSRACAHLASPPELPVFIDPTNGTRGIPS
jgi:hypothetical protein